MLKKASVITGDIISSSAFTTDKKKLFQRKLNSLQKKLSAVFTDMQLQQYRGDSIQIILTTSRQFGLNIALQLLSYMAAGDIYLRIAIGAGDINYKGKDVITSDGSAFRASGPYLDNLKKNAEVISIAGAENNFTNEWQVHSATLNYLVQNWSRQQAEVIYIQLQEQEMTQSTIAKRLKISQPSVHQRLQLAGWPVINKIINRFQASVAVL